MNQRYLNRNKFNTKKYIIITITVLTVVLVIALVEISSISAKNKQKQLEISSGNFSSIKNILEYYGCQYKNEKQSKLENFYLDIYTVFKYELYSGEESNEEFYNNIINSIAKFLNYNSFRLIDTNKEDDIEIQVVCDGNRVQTIYINGIEDYFIYMDSKINFSKYKELKKTEISIQSPELLECIQKNWTGDCNFGSREAIFQDYYIYFDEGIEVRKINGRIFNVVFKENYENQVVNGFTVGQKSDIIISKLGSPTFKNSDSSIIGYKSDDIYVFFENDQISVYRNISETGFDEFFELVDKFLDEKCTLLEFMNELTYLWPDYEEYTYNSETVFLSYPNKGIDVKINYDDTDGIILYNNIGVNQDFISKYLEYTEFVAQLQIDNVFNSEERRVKKFNQFSKECKDYQEKYETDDKRNRGKIYNYYMKLDSNEKIMAVYFISNNNQYANCELQENINSYIWVNDYCFVYSIKGKGIYYYDLKSQTKGVIIKGNDDFEIISYNNSILKYDDEEIEIIY